MGRLDSKWEQIANEAISKAEAVKCEGQSFVHGLGVIVELLQTRLEAARSEFGDDTTDGE